MIMQKQQSSTQKFTEVEQVDHDIITFTNGNACLIVEISPTNFSLLSKDEQDARVFGYASFLNSLTFPIQILINNRRVDITSYIFLLDSEIRNARNERILDYMKQYKDFIVNLVKENVILDKRFYIVVPYSYLEVGAVKTISHATQKTSSENLLPEIKATLHTKAEGLLAQISRMGLQTRILEDKELVLLFHQMYNEEAVDESTNSPAKEQETSDEKKV